MHSKHYIYLILIFFTSSIYAQLIPGPIDSGGGSNTKYYYDSDGDGYGNPNSTYVTSPQTGYVANKTDCNDNDAAINPTTRWYADADDDGWGNKNALKIQCAKPSGYVRNDDDYNDGSTIITNIAPRNFYRDADGDGYGNPGVKTYRSVKPSGYVTNNSDCNDSNASIHPNIIWYRDADSDGWGNATVTKRQCTKPSGYVRNDDDYNDGSTIITNIAPQNFYRDADGDTFGNPNNKTYRSIKPSGYVTNNSDCNDSNASIHPNIVWYRDADADGWGNKNVTTKSCIKPSGYVSNDDDYNDGSNIITNIAPRNFFRDADGDTYGNPNNKTYRSVKPSGYVTNSSDCNDSDASLHPNTTWYVDADNDGWGNATVTKKQCTKPSGYVRNDDDYNDGSNIITNIAPRNFFRDADGDTFGNVAVKTYRSVKPSGYVTNSSDCNDNDASLHPNTTWYADADGDSWGNASVTKKQCAKPSGYVRNDDDYNDGSNIITNIAPKNFYRDADNDTYGDPNNKTYRSVKPTGYVTNSSDCNDSDASLHPNTTWYADADSDGWGNASVTKKQCTKPSGYVSNDDDYNDGSTIITNIAPRHFYRDADNDTYGNPNNKTYRSVQPSGYVTNSSDCNDSDASLHPNTIWYVDADSDGWGNASVTKKQCTKPSGYVRNDDDYNDGSTIITNIAPKNFYRDADNDTYGNPNNKTYRSVKPNGYVTNSSDYDDTTANITNITPQYFYQDSDGDGFGDPNTQIYYSVMPPGYVSNNTDQCPAVTGTIQGCKTTPYTDITLSNENYVFTRVYQDTVSSPNDIQLNKDVIESVTYFDGLGRPKQQRAIKASRDEKDMVTHIAYDSLGRQSKQYLPFESSTPIGSYKMVDVLTDINTYYQNKYTEDFTSTVLADVNAYSESVFEPSPLNRVLKQGAPGEAWKANPDNDSDHTIKFDWGTNTANDSIVYFKVEFPLVNGVQNTEAPTLFYAANELYVSITKDENWTTGDGNNHTTKEYKDKLGRVILKRTYNSSSPSVGGSPATGGDGGQHDTYYVYDSFGNLTYVIPPKVVVTDGVSATELSELCYQYKYDYRNRLVEKKIPGKGDANTFESIVYNKLDQPILTQDPNQKANGEWLFTKYDVQGRVAYTGKLTDTRTRDEIQTQVNSFTNDLWVSRGSAVMIGGVTMYYNNGGYPDVQNSEVLTINYYDDYGFLGNTPVAPFVQPETVYQQTVDTRTRSLITGSKVKVLGTSDWITTVTYYDQKARPIYIASTNEYLGTTDIIESKLDFVGKVEETKTTHTKDGNVTIVTMDTFRYDHVGRLMEQNQSINGQEETIAKNSYDKLGQLQSKIVGGGLQDIKYDYNIRGWLKAINEGNTANGDLFGFKINYNNTDISGSKALYNGNISETHWKTANDNQQRWYTYEYDALNRILAANSNDGRYNLSDVSYNKNGNIKGLKRTGAIVENADYTKSSHFGMMDNLTYGYDDGNKLLSVIDGITQPFGFKKSNSAIVNNEYQYDTNGNMTSDPNKGITGISYNHLNLPTSVTVNNTEDNGNIQYIYDATGAKLKKIATEGSSLTETEYAGKYIYKNGQLQFFNTAEGYVEPDGNSWKYIYQYKDHLGNIRLSYADSNNDGSIDVVRNATDVDGDGDNAMEILEEKNYYPFGLTHKGYNDLTRGRPHNYGFTGKEEQNELGLAWVDITARNYNPELGRWMNIDPLAELMLRHSPYNYAFDNPIYFMDPDGMKPQGCCNGNSNDAVPSTPDQNLRTAVVRKAKSLWNTAKFLFHTPASVSIPILLKGLETPAKVTTALAKGNYSEAGNIVDKSIENNISQISAEEGISRGNAAGVMGAGIAVDVAAGIATDGLMSATTSAAKTLVKVDLMGGAKGTKGFTNFDIAAKSGIADDVANFGNHFETGSVGEMIVNNPQASFLENVTESMASGGTITVRGTMSNKFFNKIYNGKAGGLNSYSIVNKSENVTNSGFLRTDGKPIQGQINEIILKKR